MASLKEVRIRIKSVVSTQQITKAMKMVAASKLRKAQDNIMQLRPYIEKLGEILQNVIKETDEAVPSKYSEEREPNQVLIIPITSDRGLCGAFNSNIIKRVISLVEESYSDQYKNEALHIMPIGKKAYDHFRKNDYKVIEDYWDIFHQISFENVKVAAEFAMNEFVNGHYDRVILVYNEFKNVATQILRSDQFLPLVPENVESNSKVSADYIFEPTEEYIVQELIPQSLKIQFYKSILESYAAELGARMTAMDLATENAEELLGELRITYNRTRQAAITKEILEIVAGAEALSQE